MDKKEYEYLNEDYFSTGEPHEIFWRMNGKECSLVFENIEGKYVYYYTYGEEDVAIYKSINDALDSILYKGKTLREALTETDFQFNEIM